MKKYKIALYLPSLADGGAEIVMVNLANELSLRNDVSIDMVLVSHSGPWRDFISSNVRLVDLKCRGSGTSLLPLLRYLKRNRPDVLLSALNTTNIVSLIAKLLRPRSETKFVPAIHNTLSASLPDKRTSLKARFVTPLLTMLLRKADGIIVVSKGVATDLIRTTGIDTSSVEVIYNPVITSRIKTLVLENCSHPWIQDKSMPVLIGAGRLTTQKDFATLLKAVAIVRKSVEVRLIILGEGELRGELVSLSHSLNLRDYVDLIGFVDNPYSFMVNADVFVLSSLWEGLPTVLIESLYCGIPLVSTDCPSGPREILRDGAYGSIVPTSNAQALADAIIGKLADPSASPPPASWQAYTVESSAQHYYEYLISQNHKLGGNC